MAIFSPAAAAALPQPRFCSLRHAQTHATPVPVPALVDDAGKPPRDMRAGINTPSRPFPRAALVYEGKCFVSANRLSPRSLPIPFYPLCHGSIFILRDNTIKAGRVLADFGSNSTLDCTENAEDQEEE